MAGSIPAAILQFFGSLEALQRTSLAEVDSIKFMYENTFFLWQTAHRAY
jgi:hypothetical protein